MRTQHLWLVAACLPLLAGCTKTSSKLAYLTDGSQAFAQAKQRGVPVLLNFGGPW